MRTPLEKWFQDHRDAIERADTLVEFLAPDDITDQLILPDNVPLRKVLADHLKAIVEIEQDHFRAEEELLVPAIESGVDMNNPKVSDAIGCLKREHTQMHLLAERASKMIPVLMSDEPPATGDIAEILRISYGMQSLIRHHCTKEEREVYPLINQLSARVVDEIFRSIDPVPDIPLDHLIKPIGPDNPMNPYVAEDGESPEN